MTIGHLGQPAGAGETVTLRPAGAGDRHLLERLAGLDSAPVPSGEVLLALVDGKPRAAIAIADRRVVADPFWPTAHLVELLLVRCRQLHRPRRRLALRAGQRKARAIAARGAARETRVSGEAASAPRAAVLPSG